MKWLLVFAIVASTTTSDLLQSREMKRQGEVRDFRPTAVGRLLGRLFQRLPVIAAFVCNAISFFSLLELLSFTDLSFAVPATALSLVVETLLARLLLGEAVQARRWAGSVLVACGVALLAQS